MQALNNRGGLDRIGCALGLSSFEIAKARAWTRASNAREMFTRQRRF
jgi:hypothetical protein